MCVHVRECDMVSIPDHVVHVVMLRGRCSDTEATASFMHADGIKQGGQKGFHVHTLHPLCVQDLVIQTLVIDFGMHIPLDAASIKER